MTPAELTHLRANTSPVENTMRKLGLRTELVRSLGNDITNPVSHIDRILNRDWNSEKVAGQIGLPKSDALRRSLDAEHTFTATSNLDEASRGSRTNVLDSAQRRWGTNGAQGTNADAVAAFAGGTAVGVPATGAAAGAGV